MSSTNRGEGSTELWETPYWCVRRLLEEVWLPSGEWLEPMAGNGRIIRAVQEDRGGDVRFTACELRTECAPWLKQLGPATLRCPQDFILDFSPDKDRGRRPTDVDPLISMFDVGIANPAFSLALETVRKMLVCCEHVAVLQRLNWLGSGVNNGKHEFFDKFHPDVYLLPDRVKFLLNGMYPRHPAGAKDGKGRSIAGHLMSGDSIEYAWYVWGPKATRMKSTGLIRQLAVTNDEERLKLEEDRWGMVV